MEYAFPNKEFTRHVRENARDLIINHGLDEHKEASSAAGFKLERVIPIKVDENIIDIFSDRCYEKVKGEDYAYDLVLRK